MGVANEEDTVAPSAPPAPAPVDRSAVEDAPAPSAEPSAPSAGGAGSPRLDPAVTVMMSGLSPNVTEAQVTDFMVFCGDVVSVTLKPDTEAEGRFYAVVVFGNPYAVDDALMLSGAIVGDSQVTISNIKIVDNTPDTLDRVVDRASTATDTVGKVIQAGYIRGEGLVQQIKTKAQQYDEKYAVREGGRGVVQTVTNAMQGAGNKVKAVVRVAGRGARVPTEEESRQFQEGGARTWDQNAVSSQPQW